MKKNIFLLAVFLFIIAFNNEVFSAIKNKGRTSRSRAATKSVSGKLSGGNFVGSVQNISVVTNCRLVALQPSKHQYGTVLVFQQGKERNPQQGTGQN